MRLEFREPVRCADAEFGELADIIIDPHTGHSASKVRSATVIGPYATRTDGLSKTAFVLGPEKAMEIYNRIDDIDAIIVKLDGTVIYSKGIEPAKVPAPAK